MSLRKIPARFRRYVKNPMTNESVLEERIEAVFSTLIRIEEMLARYDERMRLLEREGSIDHMRIETKVDAAHRRIDDMQPVIQMVRDSLPGLLTVSRAMIWLGGVLGLSVLALIWSLITGQATISFHGP